LEILACEYDLAGAAVSQHPARNPLGSISGVLTERLGDYASTENLSLPDASFSLLILGHMESSRLIRENLNLILDNIIQNIKLYSKRRMNMTGKYGRSFTGKVALVAGGSRGIGEGIVRRFASDGATVAFTYSNSEEKAKRLAREIEAAGGKVLPIREPLHMRLI
jgi:3-oxoacyl-ACP reductase-like protein